MKQYEGMDGTIEIDDIDVERNNAIGEGLQTALRGLLAGKATSRGLGVFNIANAVTQGLLSNYVPQMQHNPTAQGVGTALIGTPMYLAGLNTGMSNSVDEAISNLSPDNLIGKGVPAGGEFAVAAETLSRALGIPLRQATKIYGDYLTYKSIGRRSGLTDAVKNNIDFTRPDDGIYEMTD